MIAIVFFVCLIGLSQAQICPPPEVIAPCMCREPSSYPSGIDCVGINETFNLKEVFENASAYMKDDIVFGELYISRVTYLLAIEEGTFEHLKFTTVYIHLNPALTYISPRAFNASRNTTENLYLMYNPLVAPQAVFDLAGNFKNLEKLTVMGSLISSIPDNALQNMTSLESVSLVYNPIASIGSNAFANTPRLKSLDLWFNFVPFVLQEDTFVGMNNSNSLEVDVSCNNWMEYLDQKYQPLLEQVSSLNISNFACGGVYDCNERADWICENEGRYQNILKGYNCKYEDGYEDVWEYCRERNSTPKNVYL